MKGSMAGTSLRGGLTRLIAPTEKGAEMMKKYGIEVAKTSDGSVDLSGTMDNLRSTMGGLDADTQNMVAKIIFGQTAMNGWLSIINADADAFNNLADEIDNSAGSAERMAEVMTDNVAGDMKELGSAVEESFLKIFDAIEPMIRSFIQSVTSVVTTLTKLFNNLSPSMQKLLIVFTGIIALGAPLLLVFGTMISVFGSTISSIGILTREFGQVGTSVTGLGRLISPFTSKFAGMGKTFLKVGGILGVVAVAFGVFYDKMQEDAIESTDVITESMSDAGKAMADPFIEATTEIDGVMMQMANSNVAVTTGMVEQMETSLGGMVDNTVSQLEKSQKKIKTVLEKNMKELTGSNEKQVSEMKTRIDEIYAEKIKTVEEKEKAILNIQKKAQEEGRGLYENEQRQIETLLTEIKKISVDTMSTLNTEILQLERQMLDNKDALNAEAITETIKQTKEKRDASISEANKEYDELIAIQRMFSKDLTEEENKKLNEMIRLASLRKDNLIQISNDEYSALIQTARNLARDSVDEIDWATGEVKTKWEVMTSSIGNNMAKVLGDMQYEWLQLTKWTEGFGSTMEILSLKWEKLWTKDKGAKQAIQEQIDGLEKQQQQIKDLNEEIIDSIDRVQDLPADVSKMAYEINSTLVGGVGVSLADFVHDIGGHLTQAGEDFKGLPLDVQSALIEYDGKLRDAGVNGGMKQLVEFIRGDIDTIRMNFNDLPESAQSAVDLMTMYFKESETELSGVTFEEFVRTCGQAPKDVAKEFEKLPEDIKTAMKQITPEDWEAIMEYYKLATVEGVVDIVDEFGKGGEDAGEAGAEGLESTLEENALAGEKIGNAQLEGYESTKEDLEQAGVDNGNASADGTNSTVDANTKAGENLGNATTEGFKGGLEDLPQGLKDKLADAGVAIQEDGKIIVQDFDKLARDGVTGFIDGMNAELPQLDGVTKDISDRLAGIDNIKLGNVTKQLSEVNRWLGVIQGTAVITFGSMHMLTSLPFGNTTKGLSEVNNWLMRTTNRAKDTRGAMIQLTNLPFGNTTKGLSEVNNWLMRTTNRSKDSQKALKSITEVTFGATTKGLSEINKWLTTVTTSANTVTTALRNITKVSYGGVTKGLSEINRWLKTVKDTASSTKTALNAVANAKKASVEGGIPVAPAPDDMMPQTLTREGWLDFGNINNYKTSGGYYNPNSIVAPVSSNNDSKIEVLLKSTIEQNQLLLQLLGTQKPIEVAVNVDGKQIAKASARYMETEINNINTRSGRLGGKIRGY
ncbi:MAG: phage tail tape measure protein [Paraclostridium sp.]